MMPKTLSFKLALISALLSIVFAYLHVYICLVASFLLLLIFDGIWVAKVERDRRLAKRHRPAEPGLNITKANLKSTRLVVPQSSD